MSVRYQLLAMMLMVVAVSGQDTDQIWQMDCRCTRRHNETDPTMLSVVQQLQQLKDATERLTRQLDNIQRVIEGVSSSSTTSIPSRSSTSPMSSSHQSTTTDTTSTTTTHRGEDDHSTSTVSSTNECRNKSPEADLVGIIPSQDSRVQGLTMINDSLIVSRYRSYIAIYNTTTLRQIRNITLSRSGANIIDIASRSDINRLYLTDYEHGSIYFVDMTTGDILLAWRLPDGYWPGGLSINKDKNLIITCSKSVGSNYAVTKILEYDSVNGRLIREVFLTNDFDSVYRTTQISRNQFLVNHGWETYSLHRVCLVEANEYSDTACVINCYGGRYGTGIGELYKPIGLAVDKNGFMYIADADNNRVVVLDSSLKFVHFIKISGGGLRIPAKIYLDESRDLLYIGEKHPGRVVILKLKCQNK
jgi:hypothetical protein